MLDYLYMKTRRPSWWGREAALATELGVHCTTVYFWKSGKRLPNQAHLMAIITALNLPKAQAFTRYCEGTESFSAYLAEKLTAA